MLTKNQLQLYNARRQAIINSVVKKSDRDVMRSFIFGGYNTKQIVDKCEELYKNDFKNAWNLGVVFGKKQVGWLLEAGEKEPKGKPERQVEFEVLWSNFISEVRGRVNAGIFISESDIKSLEYVGSSENVARMTVSDGWILGATYNDLKIIAQRAVVWFSEFGKLSGMRGENELG